MDLARNLRAGTAKERKRERSSNGPEGFHVEKAEEELDSTQLDNRVDVSLERIEKVLTTVLFDRLFSPASSGDAQEDENLASRIAALNLLELSLEHLGLDLGQDGGSDGFDANGRTLRDSLEEIIGVAGKGDLAFSPLPRVGLMRPPYRTGSITGRIDSLAKGESDHLRQSTQNHRRGIKSLTADSDEGRKAGGRCRWEEAIRR